MAKLFCGIYLIGQELSKKPVTKALDQGQNTLEFTFFQIVGHGSFGVVWKGKWQERTVAIKMLNVSTDDEIDQLSRISHEHIIQIFGTCSKGSNLCLVMEFSEMGSLSRVLHSNEKPIFQYNLTDAISWLLQCAKVCIFE